MQRVQLALNVGNLDEAIAFYSKLFGAEPAKRRPGYANFAIKEPPLKLVLIEGNGTPGTLNHLGVELGSGGELATEGARLRRTGFELFNQDGVTCCYAVQDKFWVGGPDNTAWEYYTVLADAPVASCTATPEVEAGSGANSDVKIGCATTEASAVADSAPRIGCC